MASFFHLMVLLGSVIGGYIFFNGLVAGKSPAVDTVVALAFVIFPYCVARSLEYLSQPTTTKDDELLSVMRRINQLMEMAVKMGNDGTPPPTQPPAKEPKKSGFYTLTNR
jgi:hypothetical protein